MGVGELDPEHGARPAQPGIDEHRPVVHVALGRAAAGSEAVAQRLSQRDRVLRISPTGRHHRPGMIVEERDEDRLAAGHVRAVQRVTDPAGVGPLGLEPAEHRRRPPVGARSVEPERGEVALQRPRRGRPPGVRGQHHRDLRGGPPGVSRLSPTANSSTSGGVCAASRRGAGTSAANPPARYARIQRSRLARLTRTGSGPNGPGWIRAATARTSRPRCLVDNAGSNASGIRP